MGKNRIELVSVGIDIGSSTSHLVLSKLLLKRKEKSASRRYVIEQRNTVYEGQIINTPLLADNTIDIVTLTEFIKEEYQAAGVQAEDIQTGAVIITGESAGKKNAREIVDAISNDTGRFVSATAGPNFESLIAALGSGATARSKAAQKTILSCDIGGGTSNMAISKNGEIISTSCVSVGGRLLAVKTDGTIWRMDEPARQIIEHLGWRYQIGDKIPGEAVETIAALMADVLFEVMTGPAHSAMACQLMKTADLDFHGTIDEYVFSGGVAELIYGNTGYGNDIGQILADQITALIPRLKSPVVEPINKIRATVIGAGAYSLSISGSSGYMDDRIAFPLRNIPVIRVDVDRSKLSIDHVKTQIQISFQRFDIIEGEKVVALYFKDPVNASYPKLELFAKSIEEALHNSINNKLPIILIFEGDIACSVGNVIRRETSLKTNLLSLDELILSEGDWIDIGEPLVEGQVFPVTVKSLVF